LQDIRKRYPILAHPHSACCVSSRTHCTVTCCRLARMLSATQCSRFWCFSKLMRLSEGLRYSLHVFPVPARAQALLWFGASASFATSGTELDLFSLAMRPCAPTTLAIAIAVPTNDSQMKRPASERPSGRYAPNTTTGSTCSMLWARAAGIPDGSPTSQRKTSWGVSAGSWPSATLVP
jgi:hypothetical protein